MNSEMKLRIVQNLEAHIKLQIIFKDLPQLFHSFYNDCYVIDKEHIEFINATFSFSRSKHVLH